MCNTKQRIPLESLPDSDVLEYYLDWNDAMCNAFGSFRKPKRRFKNAAPGASYTLKGVHATFYDVRDYAIEKGLISPPKSHARQNMENVESIAKQLFSTMRVLSRQEAEKTDWVDFTGGREKVFYAQLALAFSKLTEYSLARANDENPEPLTDIIGVTEDNVDDVLASLTTIKKETP